MKKAILLISLAILIAAAQCYAYEIIPCSAGNKWEYDSYKVLKVRIILQGNMVGGVNDVSQGTSVYEVLGIDKLGVVDYQEKRTFTSTKGDSFSDKISIKLKDDISGLLINSTYSESDSDTQGETQTYNPPLKYFIKDAAKGKAWDVGVMRDSEIQSPTNAKAVDLETVTVPAGTFKNCLKVVYYADKPIGKLDILDKKFEIVSGISRGIYWIAEGVGVVKELQINTSVAKSDGPNGEPLQVEAVSCTVNELKPGYVVKK